MSTAATTAAATSSQLSKAAQSRTKLADNLDTFLNMLTTQLKNQDPLSPMDSTQFTNQLVQFANVEQQINANTNLEKLVAMNHATQMVGAVGYMGKTIQASSEYLPLQSGSAEFAYTTPEGVDKVAITIYDSTGKPVKSIVGDANAGTHTVSWDGKSNSDEQLKDGAYKIQVTASNGDAKGTDLETAVTGTVTGVASDNKSTFLTLGDAQITLDDILTIKAPKAAS